MNEKITKLNLMLGGMKPKTIDCTKYWCSVDSGLEYLLEFEVIPIFCYGDMDSTTLSKNLSNVIYKYKESQNLTDTEFALKEIIKDFPNIETINIYGATGKRLDHFYANILLLSNELFKNIKINIIDDNNLIFYINSNVNILKKIEIYKYISFIPIYENTIITIENAKYSINNLCLSLNRANATSNEFYNSKPIKLLTNKPLIVIYSKD